MREQVKPAIVSLLLFTVLTGIAYPLLITGIAQVAFPRQANGSIITVDGKAVGSSLIGQPFAGSQYFWSRPSATGPFPYNAAASSGSNLGPISPDLQAAVAERVAKTGPNPPVDLVTASGSGLDPHITPAGAEFQVARIATSRGLSEDEVRALVRKHTQGRTLGILGEPRVNVLELNLELDAQARR